MGCRLYFGRIVPTILDYLSASVEMSTLGLSSDTQSLHQRVKSCALHSMPSGDTTGIGRAQSLYNDAGDLLDS